MKYKAAIIMNNTLEALGVKHLLAEDFAVASQVYRSLAYVPDVGADFYDFYFTSPDVFIKHIDFFLPRKHKVIVITSDSTGEMNENLLCSNAEESALIDMINGFLTKVERSGNDQEELSQREIDVLRLIASGMINKEIAESLGISVNTVLSHRKNITAKLGIRSVSGLTFYAMMNGLIAPK